MSKAQIDLDFDFVIRPRDLTVRSKKLLSAWGSARAAVRSARRRTALIEYFKTPAKMILLKPESYLQRFHSERQHSANSSLATVGRANGSTEVTLPDAEIEHRS